MGHTWRFSELILSTIPSGVTPTARDHTETFSTPIMHSSPLFSLSGPKPLIICWKVFPGTQFGKHFFRPGGSF